MAPSQSLASSPEATPTSEAPPATAMDCLRRCRWADALRLLNAIPNPDLATTLQLRLARNMLAMQTHRPEVYASLASIASAKPTGQYRLVAIPGAIQGHGRLSIARKLPNGDETLLCPGGDPNAAVEASLKHLCPLLDKSTPVAICGIGDGSLIAAITRLPPPAQPRIPGLLPAIYVIEPDQEIFLHCFMLQDFTGQAGPIENRQFIWSVGPRWRQQLLEQLRADPFLPKPVGLIDPGYDCPELIREVERVNQDLDRWESELARDVAAAYANVTPEEFCAVFSAPPPRPPRAMLLTSRFTTVLQHSIRDLAAAMDSLGWETRVLIEPTNHHHLPNLALRQALIEFRPDVVFTIDHLRRESHGVFPPSLPFVCWVQDDLPNLTNSAAGRSVTPRDFVLITGPKTYVDKFDYPARQCIYLGKLTRISTTITGATGRPSSADQCDLSSKTLVSKTRPVAPGAASKESAIPDVTYVSNASALPASIIKKFQSEFADQPAVQELMRLASDRVCAIYSAGGFLQTAGEARRVIADCEGQLGGRLRSDAGRETLAMWIVNHLNNTLYRQQALRWVVAACDRLDLKLGLYGNGWEKNEEFARFAHGPVAYGPPLEELTRRSAINLQIVPFSCLHQRLLDGVAAGGFFLIRGHPIDQMTKDLGDFLRGLPDGIKTLADAQQSLAPVERKRLEDIMARLNIVVDGDDPDPVANFRGRQAEGHEYLYEVPPLLDEVTFHDAAGLDQLINRFMASPEDRGRVVASQRRFVEEHYAYEAGVRRVMRSVSRLITGENPA